MQRFIKYNPDSEMAKYLQTKPIANHLANIIATRARRTDCPYTGLKVGQCFLGNVKKLGITPKQYRTAKLLLERIGFSTFLGANKGTTATLVSIEVYDINVNLQGEQRGEPQGELGDKQGANKGRLTKNVKKDKNEEELKNNKDIVDFLEVANYFKSTTGRKILIGKTDAKIRASDKYKSINARIKETSVKECKLVIDFMYKKWAKNKEMQEYIRISTFFGFKNFEKYLDAAINQVGLSQEKKFPYELPTFKDKEQRALYFLARYNEYKPQLDEYLINTEYRQRALIEKDAEGLCFGIGIEVSPIA